MGDSNLHAILSPSGASRWMVCTPSARLEKQFPDSAGDAAREGTLAHAIGELMLRRAINQIGPLEYSHKLGELIASDLIVNDDLEIIQEFYCASMHEYCEQYTTFVMEQLAEARKHTPDAKLYIEQRLDLSDYIPEGFGTGDVGIAANTTFHGIDLKYGKGVEVSAINNTQMKIYGLGWLAEHSMLYDIETLRMTIFQPRIDNFSTWEISVADLLQWAEEVLRPQALLAFAGQGTFVAGKHCQFCRVELCKARSDYELEVMKFDFQEGTFMTDADVAFVLTRKANLIKWVNSIAEHALAQAVHNDKKWPGFKLIEGRSDRSYVSDERIVNALVLHGIAEEDLYEPKKVLGVTKMEDLLGKKNFKKFLFGLVVKPPGKLALVPEDDKRDEFNSVAQATKDFADEFEEDPMA